MNIEDLYNDLGGRAAIRAEVEARSDGKLRISASQLSDWSKDGTIPSCWYNLFDEIAVERGVTCPRGFFAFKDVA